MLIIYTISFKFAGIDSDTSERNLKKSPHKLNVKSFTDVPLNSEQPVRQNIHITNKEHTTEILT